MESKVMKNAKKNISMINIVGKVRGKVAELKNEIQQGIEALRGMLVN